MSAKSPSLALYLSLGANIVLLGLAARSLWREHPAPPAFPGPAPAATTPARIAPPPAPARDEAARAEPAAAGPAPTKLTPAAVAELEQAGIPRDILVNVLLADLNRRWTAEGVALQKKYAPGPVPERELRELSRRSLAEQAQELRGALGEDGYRAWDKEQALHALNRARPPGDELPMNAAEAEQAYRLQKTFDDENRELQEMLEDGAANPADIGRLQAQAQQAMDRELEKLLGKPRFDALRGNPAPADGNSTLARQ